MAGPSESSTSSDPDEDSLSHDWDYIESDIQDNDQYFDPDRQRIFHHMVMVHDLTVDGDNTVCGVAQDHNESEFDGLGDLSAIPHGDHGGALDNCSNIADTAMEELGHHHFGFIEPRDERCGDDEGHDVFGDYAMDAEECNPEDKFVDWWDPSTKTQNRWGELFTHAMNDECSADDADEPLACPSPGDLNNGLFPNDVDRSAIR